MNAEELIGSGLLEAYVLGQTTPDESVMVERSAAADVRVRKELDELEASLETLAMKEAVAPPARSRAKLMQAIGGEDARKVLPMKPVEHAGSSPRWLAAASVVALLGSLAMNMVLYTRVGHMQDQLAQFEKDRTVLAQELQVQKASLTASQDQLAVVLDPHKRVVPLAGLALAPAAGARIYWDAATKDVYLDVLSLPAPPEGKQYQLWALADGQPVDAGVFDVADGANALQRMKPIGSAQAFAVTLEAKGGVPSPTLSAMYLMGQVG